MDLTQPVTVSNRSSSHRFGRFFALALALTASLAACQSHVTAPAPVPDVPYEAVSTDAALAAINAYRAESGVGSVVADPALAAFAAAYVRRMLDLGVMTHQPTVGETLRQRLVTAGYGHRHAVENLGHGQRRLQDVMAAWKASPSHDEALRDPNVTRLGIASIENPAEAGDVYWCLVMARPIEPGR